MSRFSVFLVALTIALGSSHALAHTKKIVDFNNKYGGHSIETKFTKAESEEGGVVRLIKHFGSANKEGIRMIRKSEHYYTPAHTKNSGIFKSYLYYDEKGEGKQAVHYDPDGGILNKKFVAPEYLNE